MPRVRVPSITFSSGACAIPSTGESPVRAFAAANGSYPTAHPNGATANVSRSTCSSVICDVRERGGRGYEEYLNSEKYEIKMRDWNRQGNIKEFVASVNGIRNENSALHHLTNICFLPADGDDILFYVKASLDRSNVILAAVNLDPFQSHVHGHGAARGNWCCTGLVLHRVGVAPGEIYQVTDLLTGAVYMWRERNYVRLDPNIEPAHILRVEKPR